ncbi:hypothetical protein [Desulfallas thermosapovorans]|uniref:PAS domain-containing protein n=1 Tax=Desulfallas thermosapovorans DSM 6562 TaxID=1121431 RepID=A0A5S4ZQU7_9FIRM|nr:hypothetical protein [Desulfallas thermosapovorans]TYO95282.1 hypothetical protein LX24_01631 [Desulfallas thermosapovorans DSM 6562]
MHKGHCNGLNDVINNELILAAVSERIVYYDKNMKILWANKAASEIAGLPVPGQGGR